MNRAVWIVINLAAGISALLLACNKPTEPDDAQPVSLRAVDASCTEVWLEVKLSESIHPRTIEIRRDTTLLVTTTLSALDTLIVDEGLLPNRQYTYTLTRRNVSFGQPLTATITTLDTTSHDFTFQIDTLGVNSSVLFDVAIISENDIWAVGELYLNDSSGVLDPLLYNAAHWDGMRWNIIRIPYIYQGSPSYGVIRYVFAFDENNVWFGNSTHWNGQHFHNVNLGTPIFFGIGSNKMWGNGSTGELYVVGNSGTIAYSPDLGSTWRRIESGTALGIQDVFGSVERNSGKMEVLAVASDHLHSYSRRIVRIEGQTASVVSDSGIPTPLSGIWFVAHRTYYTVGSGIFNKRSLTGGKWLGAPNQLTPYYSYAVRGTALNNIIVVGAYCDVLHFNGWNWNSYPELLSPGQSWYSVSMKGNRMIAVGYVGNRAAVLRGVRQ